MRLGIASVLLVLGALRLAADPAFLVKDGAPQAQIVIAEQPPRMTTLAAHELRDYLHRISGAELPIVTQPAAGTVAMYVGRSAFTDQLGIADTDLDAGAYRMVSGDGWLALLGHDSDFTPPQPYKTTYSDDARVLQEWDALTGEKWLFPHTLLFKKYSRKMGLWDYDERGSLNAVYGYLRSLGVRWYMQGELGEIVPKQTTIPLPQVDQTVRPDFSVRDFGPYAPVWIGDPEESILWHLRMGFDPGRPEWGLSASRWLGHGICLVHGRDETKRDHPEYFALYDGKRFTGDKYSEYGKPCLSSPELFAANLRFIRAFFRIYPDEPMICVMPADAYVRICECPLCQGKDDLERGSQGHLSDYVWDYVNRVAQEIRKTNPDKTILCCAYGSYLLPPKKIATLSPNLAVTICQHRGAFGDPATEKLYLDIRQGWLDRLTSGDLYIYEYYLYSRPERAYEGLPVFFPHAIARDLQRLRGVSKGEMVEQSRAQGTGMHAPAFNHLNAYVTARLYWDANLDVDALLAEYYHSFYGPAADAMKAFVDFSEQHWSEMLANPEPITEDLALLATAQKAAGDTVYGQRIALLADYLVPMAQLRDRLQKGREDVPSCRALLGNPATFKLDGVLDEPFWERASTYGLRELETGRAPYFPTQFSLVWAKDALYVGIRCQDLAGKPLNIATTRNEDPAIWDGDTVELLIETQTHAYYQIAVNPSGAWIDADRAKGLDSLWSSGAEVAAHVAEDHWTVELRLPVGSGVVGRKPSETYPWFVNVCRQRARATGSELSAFSPTSQPGFHDPARFARLISPPN